MRTAEFALPRSWAPMRSVGERTQRWSETFLHATAYRGCKYTLDEKTKFGYNGYLPLSDHMIAAEEKNKIRER